MNEKKKRKKYCGTQSTSVRLFSFNKQITDRIYRDIKYIILCT